MSETNGTTAAFDLFAQRCEAAGVHARWLTAAHFQIHGRALVDYWPWSETFKVNGQSYSGTIDRAISYAIAPPPIPYTAPNARENDWAALHVKVVASC